MSSSQENKLNKPAKPAKINIEGKEAVDNKLLEQDKKLKRRNSYLIKSYGITLEDYERIYNKQEGCCKLCGIEEEKLVVDHDHKTNLVRGLLCHSCNVGLGHFKDNEATLLKAIEYIKKSRKYEVQGIEVYLPEYKEHLIIN